MKLLTVNNLSAGYNGTNIIRNISFSVDSGQIIGILGANGCGKTTLIKSLANLLPHTGNCQLDTITVESVSPKELARLCGYIPQNNSISLDLTLFDVVMMGFNPEPVADSNPANERNSYTGTYRCWSWQPDV